MSSDKIIVVVFVLIALGSLIGVRLSARHKEKKESRQAAGK